MSMHPEPMKRCDIEQGGDKDGRKKGVGLPIIRSLETAAVDESSLAGDAFRLDNSIRNNFMMMRMIAN